MIILASQSPRRKEIMTKMGLDFKVVPATGEEVVTDTDPEKVVMSLSSQKANEIFHKNITENGERDIVIGADTVVSYNHKILGKPKNREDAFATIRSLSGNTHEVFTGVTVIYRDKTGHVESRTFSECTKVTFYELSDDEIREYVESGEADDKAGSYAIQGIFCKYVKKIDGNFDNVVGLPAARLFHELKELSLI